MLYNGLMEILRLILLCKVQAIHSCGDFKCNEVGVTFGSYELSCPRRGGYTKLEGSAYTVVSQTIWAGRPSWEGSTRETENILFSWSFMKQTTPTP